MTAEDRDNAIFQGLHGFKMASGETPPFGKREDYPGDRLFACDKVRETLAFVLKNN